MQVVNTGVNAALRREVASGVRLAITLRLAAVTTIAAWIIVRVGLEASWHYLTILGVLLASGIFQWRLAPKFSVARHIAMGVLILLDMGSVTYALVIPPPDAPELWPAAMQLRLGNFDYFYVFIALTTLAYSPALCLWNGVAAALAWSAGIAFVLSQPDSFTMVDFEHIRGLSIDELIALLLDPHYISAVIWTQEVLLALLMTGILAATAHRARSLAFREAMAAAERSNLSRYFSPNIVDDLARNRDDLHSVRSHDVAILFCDIVGFTAMSETQPPANIIALLRDIHGRLARVIFEHGGTVEKYLGDGLMASFGTPRPGKDDAARALRAAFAILASMEGFNDARRNAGLPPVEIGIGLHCGPVVLGNIGDEMMLEFAVIGDTVNVASRLETLTRELNSPLVVSQHLIEASQEQDTSIEHLIDQLKPGVRQVLRNREQPIVVRMVNIQEPGQSGIRA